MESDLDNTSSDDAVEEKTEDNNLQEIQNVFLYGNLCEELKKVKQALDENQSNLVQLLPFYTVDENSDEEIAQMKDISTHENLCEGINRLKRAIDFNRNKLAELENIILQVTLSQTAPTTLECLISPIVSPIHETQDLSDDPNENLPCSPNLTGTLQQPEINYDQKEALLQDSTKEFKAISPRKEMKEYPDSPPVSPMHKLQDTSDAKTLQDFTDSDEKYDGKGKLAANPKFRYKKRLTPEVSPVEVPSYSKRPTPDASPTLVSSKETSVKPSKPASLAPDIKTLKSQSPNSVTRISPSKRKDVESDENSIIGFSRLSGNCGDDIEDTKIAKKLKFDVDEEKSSKEFPIITGLLTKKHEQSDSSENTDQSNNDSKELTLPSLSGQSKKIIYSSSSEESSLTGGNEDVSRSETEGSSLTSESDVPASGKEESSRTSVSDLSAVPN